MSHPFEPLLRDRLSSSSFSRCSEGTLTIPALLSLLASALLLCRAPQSHAEGSRHSAAPRPIAAVAVKRSYEDDDGLHLSEAFALKGSGVKMPRMTYRAVWNSSDAAVNAIRAGFRGFDIVGVPGPDGLGGRSALTSLFELGVSREELFIQTRVYPKAAETAYPGAPIAKQVELSIKSSLYRFGLTYVDSLILHCPYPQHEQTMEAWRAMEEAVQSGLVKQLGISNVDSTQQLQRFYQYVRIKPMVWQQRFHAGSGIPGFDLDMYAWCEERGMAFHVFWSREERPHGLKVTPAVSSTLKAFASRYYVTPSIVFLRFVMGLGEAVVVSTSGEHDLGEDLSARNVPLEASDARSLLELVKPIWDEDKQVQEKQKLLSENMDQLNDRQQQEAFMKKLEDLPGELQTVLRDAGYQIDSNHSAGHNDTEDS